MSIATQQYISTLLVYFFVDLIAAWGLDLQFGMTGVLNFAYIIFQAAGAYTVEILSLGPASQSAGGLRYLGGASLPFPLPLLAAVVVGAILGGVVGLVGLRRLRSDYQAMVMLVVSVIATTVAMSQVGLVNGPTGLFGASLPLESALRLGYTNYAWAFSGFCAVVCAVVGLGMWRIAHAPFGRKLRAIRENSSVAAALGRDPRATRLLVFVVGGGIAALSGGLLVEFVGAWAPSGWLYPETFVIFTAVIVGGRGNVFGVAGGCLLIQVGLTQAVSYLPLSGDPVVLADMEWVITGIVMMGFIWIRPQGLLPEGKRTYDRLVQGATPRRVIRWGSRTDRGQ